MKVTPEEILQLASALEALRPYLPELVVVGGWAHRLFHLHPLARPRDFAPLRTNDVDLALVADLQPHAPGPIPDLLKKAGFEPRRKSMEPPITRYERNGLLIEFIADLQGSSRKRDGSEKVAIELGGVTAEQLLYVYPLHVRPWSPVHDNPTLAVTRVANPVTYLFQKILVNPRRIGGKDANDVLYIADTVDVFGDQLDALRNEWVTAIRDAIHPKHVSTFREVASALYVVKDVHRRAARIADSIERARSPDQLAEIIRVLVATVFV
jgi:hypothetical protein